MNNLAKAGLIGLAYSGIMVMTATDAPAGREGKVAARQADKAAKALNKHDAGDAVVAAEAAVALAPRVAAYRMLLGQGYLQAGRFASAGQAFGEVLQLDPTHGKAALNLALTQIAWGDWQTARDTLARHADSIPGSDRGLAMALAGDTAGAVQLLTALARSPETSVKVRQNLALSYALAGQWQAARVVAAADMSPADVDARLEQWAVFAQPRAASDQVAGLLGVQPVPDGGQPTALALNAVPARVAVAAVEPAVAAPAPVEVASATPLVSMAVPAAVSRIRFGPRQEVVQPLTAVLIAAADGPIKVATGSPRVRKAVGSAPTGGSWYVQLGAYENAGVAKDAWTRAQRRFAGFGERTPNGVAFRTAGASYYRLSVGGFSRAGADSACRQYRVAGGQCFVRAGAGDQVASWARGRGTQLAMR